jgi:hypothetical protein
VGEAAWRALFGVGLEWLAPRLAQAFPPDVFYVRKTPSGWQWWRFADDETQETGTLGMKQLWQRRSPLEEWAAPLGLPVARLTLPPRSLDYETVAQLDQRSLLHEDTPRRYHFLLPQGQRRDT